MTALQTYSENRDERAFRSLVDAHIGMVFGTAMRRVGDRGIRSQEALPAWLHRATLLERGKGIRGEERRRKRMEKPGERMRARNQRVIPRIHRPQPRRNSKEEQLIHHHAHLGDD